MGRLIDTDSLKDRASEYTLNEDEYRRFCEIIDAEPTAFDLGKVVEQLKELKESKTIGTCKVMIKEAIEIVTSGSSQTVRS
jgi:hypothetical protein